MCSKEKKEEGRFSFPSQSDSVEYPQGHLGSRVVSRSIILNFDLAEHV